jgi:hypothetical protein
MNGCTSRRGTKPVLVILNEIGYGLNGSTWPSASIVTRGQSTIKMQNAKSPANSLLANDNTLLGFFGGGFGCGCFSCFLRFRDLDIYISIL